MLEVNRADGKKVSVPTCHGLHFNADEVTALVARALLAQGEVHLKVKARAGIA